ncbi:MAG TPA: acyltransferase [Thermoanaerobaculia bacterium]|nr:acyltransferase [Thermoanaerobaculia bacterium]
MVLFAHLSGSRGFIYWPTLYLFGLFAVRMFFVVSGFLITSVLVRELHKTGSIRLGRFYFRRTLRVFPASYFYIFAIALLGTLGWIEVQHGDLIAALTYTMNMRDARGAGLGHLWTLAIEEQFYLLWPLTLGVLGLQRSTRFLCAVILGVPVIRVILPTLLDAHWSILWSDHSFLFWSDALASGCLLATLWPKLKDDARLQRILSARWFALIPASAILINLVRFTKIYWFICEPYMNLAIALSLAWAVTRPEATVGRILNWRAVAFVGVLSYSAYLWQQPFLLNRKSESILVTFPVSIVAAFIAAMLSYLLIEAPMLRVRTAIECRWQARHAVPVVVVTAPAEIHVRPEVAPAVSIAPAVPAEVARTSAGAEP